MTSGNKKVDDIDEQKTTPTGNGILSTHLNPTFMAPKCSTIQIFAPCPTVSNTKWGKVTLNISCTHHWKGTMKVIHEPLSSSFNLPSYFSCSFQKNNLVDRMPQCGWFLVLSMTLLTNQSFWFSLTSMIRDGHKPLRVFSSARSTTSPMRKLRGGLNQFSLSFRCGSYSFIHPCQNTSDRYWTWCNLHQEYCLQYYYDST